MCNVTNDNKMETHLCPALLSVWTQLVSVYSTVGWPTKRPWSFCKREIASASGEISRVDIWQSIVPVKSQLTSTHPPIQKRLWNIQVNLQNIINTIYFFNILYQQQSTSYEIRSDNISIVTIFRANRLLSCIYHTLYCLHTFHHLS